MALLYNHQFSCLLILSVLNLRLTLVILLEHETERKEVFERISQKEQRGLTEGSRIHDGASIVAGRKTRSGKTLDNQNRRQEKDVEKHAKE